MLTWWVNRSRSAPVSRSVLKVSVHSSKGRLLVISVARMRVPSGWIFETRQRERAHALVVTPDDLDRITPQTVEAKYVPGEKVLLQHRLCLGREDRDPVSHVFQACRLPRRSMCRAGCRRVGQTITRCSFFGSIHPRAVITILHSSALPSQHAGLDRGSAHKSLRSHTTAAGIPGCRGRVSATVPER